MCAYFPHKSIPCVSRTDYVPRAAACSENKVIPPFSFHSCIMNKRVECIKSVLCYQVSEKDQSAMIAVLPSSLLSLKDVTAVITVFYSVCVGGTSCMEGI